MKKKKTKKKSRTPDAHLRHVRAFAKGLGVRMDGIEDLYEPTSMGILGELAGYRFRFVRGSSISSRGYAFTGDMFPNGKEVGGSFEQTLAGKCLDHCSAVGGSVSRHLLRFRAWVDECEAREMLARKAHSPGLSQTPATGSSRTPDVARWE
jgi:hypothetical protein